MESFIKIGLAILLILCLLDMPYGYFQFVRFVAMAGFGILAVAANNDGRQTEFIIFIFLALLFQPFFKVALGRELWNIVDIIIAIALVISALSKSKK